MEMEGDNPDDHNLFMFHDSEDGKEGENVEVKIEKKDGKTIKKVIVKDKEGNIIKEKEMEVDGDMKSHMMMVNPGGDENVFIHKIEDGEPHKRVKVEIKSENGKTIKKVTETDKDGNIISETEEEVDGDVPMEWTSDDGSAVKIIKMGDGEEGDVEIMTEEIIDENGAKKHFVHVIKVKIEDPSKEEMNKLDSEPLSDYKENNLKMDRFELFPNPNSGKFNLNFTLPKKGDTEVRVLDVQGRELYFEQLNNFSGEYSNEIEIANAARGVYFLHVSQKGKQMVKKIITE